MADIININDNSQTKAIQKEIIAGLENLLEQAKNGEINDIMVVYCLKSYSINLPAMLFSSDRGIFMLGALEMAKEFIKKQFTTKG